MSDAKKQFHETALGQALAATRALRPITRAKYEKIGGDFISRAGPKPEAWIPMHVERWMQEMIDQGTDPRHVNNQLYGLKTIARRYSALYGGVDFAKPIEPFPTTATSRNAIRRSLTEAEARKLVATCAGQSIEDSRDVVILLLGLKGGLRRREISLVRWGDLNGMALMVHGKGGHDAKIILDSQTLAAISVWRQHCPSTAPSDSLLCRLPLTLDGEARNGGLSHDGVYSIIKKRARQAEIADMSPHTLRHTCATLLAMSGVPIWRVSQHLRQTSGAQAVGVTGAYLHDLDAEAGHPVSEAIKLL